MMNKQQFEKEIINLLVKEGYMKEGQIAQRISILLYIESLPEVDIRFLVN